MYEVTKGSKEVLDKYSCFRMDRARSDVGAVVSSLRVSIENCKCQIELLERWQPDMDSEALKRSKSTTKEIGNRMYWLEEELKRIGDL